MSDDLVTIHNDTDNDVEFSRMFWDWYIPRFGPSMFIKLSDIPSYNDLDSSPEERQIDLLNAVIEKGLARIGEESE